MTDDVKGGYGPPKQVRMPDQLLRLIQAQAKQMQEEIDELKRWEKFFLGDTEGAASQIGRHLADIQRLCRQKLEEFEGDGSIAGSLPGRRLPGSAVADGA